MFRWIFALLALFLALSALKKEAATMRFPQTRFYSPTNPCSVEKYEGWFRELRRLGCYPRDYPDRLEGIWGPLQVKDK